MLHRNVFYRIRLPLDYDRINLCFCFRKFRPYFSRNFAKGRGKKTWFIQSNHRSVARGYSSVFLDKRSLERFRKKIFLPRVSSKSSRDLRGDSNMWTCFCRYSTDYFLLFPRDFVLSYVRSSLEYRSKFVSEIGIPFDRLLSNSNNHDCPIEKAKGFDPFEGKT